MQSQALDKLSALRNLILTFAVLSPSAAFPLADLRCVSLIRDRSSVRKRCAISRYTQVKQVDLHSCVNQVKGHNSFLNKDTCIQAAAEAQKVTHVCTMESRCFPSLGILQGYCSLCLDSFMFPWEETDFCNEVRWLDDIFWHSVSLPASSNFFVCFNIQLGVSQ